jgi:hypothetical protein
MGTEMDALPPSEEHLLEVWQALQAWLGQSKSGRSVLADFQVDPRAGTRNLAAWLQSHSAQAPPQMATYVSGGRVDRLVNIAHASTVILTPAQPSPATRLLHHVFAEYLGLPSLFEMQAKVRLADARRRGRYSEHKRVESLWRGIHPPKYPGGRPYRRLPAEFYTLGSVVKLHNVQLCTFVNRAPRFSGRPYLAELPLDRTNLLVGAHGPSLLDVEILMVDEFALGDVRFGIVGDRYLVNAVDAPSDGFSDAVVNTIPALGRGDRGTIDDNWFYNQLWPLRREAKADGLDITPMTEYGFPVLLTSLVYHDIADILEGYGAVFAEEVTGFLAEIPADVQLSLKPGVPKVALYVEDRAMIKGKKRPKPVVASAWTVAGNNQESRYQFAYWPFIIGMDGYQDSLRQATTIIGEAMSKHGLEAIFEFDHKTNWFSDQTLFGPDDMIEMYRSVQLRSGSPDDRNPEDSQ